MNYSTKYFIISISALFFITTCIPFVYADEDETGVSSGFFGFRSKKDKTAKKEDETKKKETIGRVEDRKVIKKIKKIEQIKETKEIKEEKVTKKTIKPLPRTITEIFTPEEVRNTIKHYCETNQQYNPYKAFTIYDPNIDTERKLQFISVNDTVIKKDDMFYASANFLDVNTKETIVLDFDVVAVDDDIGVADIYIKQVDKNIRFTYDKTDKRIYTN